MRNSTLALIAIGAIAPLQAEAQTPPRSSEAQAGQAAEPVVAGGVRKFEPAYFARFNPVTAQDMVRQLPGFSIDNGNGVRGFGAAAGNVLIDGQRPSTKATAISEELTRIPAKDVLRIELIGASAAGDIDVRGYTELANVVMKPSTGVQISTTTLDALALIGERIGAVLGGTRAWKTSDLGARLNVQVGHKPGRNETAITNTAADGTLTSTRQEFSQQNLDELLINGSLNWNATARDALSLTGRVMGRALTRDFGSTRRGPTGAPIQFQTDDYTEKDIVYVDLGGDWEHKFSPETSIKLISVNSFTSWRPQEFFEAFSPSGARTSATAINTDNTRGEHVLRGVLTQRFGASDTLEAGLEYAYNYRNTARTRSDSIGAGPLMSTPFPGADVHEDRWEAFVTNTWRASPQLTLELGFNYEGSTISSESAGLSKEQKLTYPKPRAVVTWTPTKDDQIRASVERKVGQLDFSQFASSVQLTENTDLAGNLTLHPEQIWDSSLQWKRAIGQRGSVALTLFYAQADDVLDFIPVRVTSGTCPSRPNAADCVFTGYGNIGDGRQWRGRLEATLPLDGVGVKGGRLKIFGEATDTEVTDPVTGEKRHNSDEISYNANIDFRQDLPELKLAWGGDYSWAGDYEYYRIDQIDYGSYGPGDLDLFIETTAVKGVTLRLSVDNLGDQPARNDRRFFTPNRFPGGAYASREYRESKQGPLYQFTVSGSF